MTFSINGNTWNSSSATIVVMNNDVSITGDVTQRRTYIVHVRPPENSTMSRFEDLMNWYKSFLPAATTNSTDSRFIYAYSEAIIGFAANLTEDEVKDMEKNDNFLKAYPDRVLPLLTTRTPDFLGLQTDDGPWRNYGMGKGIIIGLLDTGITPDHPSFGDEGLLPPPSKWKGSCDPKFHCNNKLIGAKRFFEGRKVDMSTDTLGHGTHTASTAAGNFVKNATVLGNGNGTAAGTAPHAHLAIYQVCVSMGCFASDVLAGMDEAINDGVDVLSLSLGGISRPFHDDVIAVGAFRAVKRGIFVSCAAGNSGPANTSLSNEAPWILTVGASTMDRQIKAIVKLGNGRELLGESLFQPPDFPSTMLPLVDPTSARGGDCNFDNVVFGNVKGKFVACEKTMSRAYLDYIVKKGGGAGIVILNQEEEGDTTIAEAYSLPASRINFEGASNLRNYLNSTNKPVASISFNGTCLGTSPAPVIAFFSSRGPSGQSPGILKPDILGPGVNVLAAWPSDVGSSTKNSTNRTFNIISGTSMSTPHLSGIAALIKAAHTDWSPAAIKSAIMTTADIADNDSNLIRDEARNSASFFAMGAGHVNASKAMNPGLVYDTDVDDYVAYLCGLDYEDKNVELITGKKVPCSTVKKITEAELNYPSLVVSQELGRLTVNRTVTNVEEGEYSTYTIDISMPEGISIDVSPRTLKFSAAKEKKSFTISMNWSTAKTGDAKGDIKWVSKKHVVRIPIVIY
ncbi:Subtilisin-like protease SBT1.2 [Ananas comosus]|uniref:Subtilisin-like protease SBT1.2 n=2 Tax=Ananas comosus TaxID=4615 RepID=A0A199V1U0_ANACO|nr:Subtilisin-like protease SBT1.2 [Ananas comosus]